jgi:hypothetical protein
MPEVTLANPFRGTAGGNPLVNPDFDFSMRLMPNWIQEQRVNAKAGVSDTPAEAWILHNTLPAEQQSWMSVEFYAGIQADSLEELESYLKTRYPDLIWSNHSDRSMHGFQSNQIYDPNDPAHMATLGRLVFFMDRKMIVSISWRRHPDNGGSADVTHLIASMDRYTAAPAIKSIQMLPGPQVRAGERACYQIRVDDLKSSFDEDSLREFKIAGLPSFWIWNDVKWNESTGAFEICLLLPKSISHRNDLLIERLQIRNEREQTSRCELSLGLTDPQLTCRTNFDRSGVPDRISMGLPEVENPNPDLSAPKIESLAVEINAGQYILRGTLQDDSAIAGGWLLLKETPGDSSTIFIAPWQIEGGSFSVNLTPQSTNGTRRVNEIILSDENGNAGRLMACPPEGLTCDRRNYVFCVNDTFKKRDNCADTGIKIVEYFSRYSNKMLPSKN